MLEQTLNFLKDMHNLHDESAQSTTLECLTFLELYFVKNVNLS